MRRLFLPARGLRGAAEAEDAPPRRPARRHLRPGQARGVAHDRHARRSRRRAASFPPEGGVQLHRGSEGPAAARPLRAGHEHRGAGDRVPGPFRPGQSRGLRHQGRHGREPDPGGHRAGRPPAPRGGPRDRGREGSGGGGGRDRRASGPRRAAATDHGLAARSPKGSSSISTTRPRPISSVPTPSASTASVT